MMRKMFTGWAVRFKDDGGYYNRKLHSTTETVVTLQSSTRFTSKLEARVEIQPFLDNGNISLRDIVFVRLYRWVNG